MKTSRDKRTLMLKALLEKSPSPQGPVLTRLRDELDLVGPPHHASLYNAPPAIEADPKPEQGHTNQTLQDTPAQRHSVTALATLLNREISKSAASLELDEADLKAWLSMQQSAPSTAVLALLRTMRQLQLDPLCDEVCLLQHEDGHWQAYITIEGCCTLLNRHPQFNGLTFTQSNTDNAGVPEWIECTIYRRDREVPITVREYLVEVEADKPVWKKMPRRMLRHRALQQCVKLAILI
jgi:hypothetical protein